MPENPWRFLTPLRGEDPCDRSLIELTRGDELHLITQMIASSRVGLLYAFSGNGKTSLLEAGVRPFFEREGYAVFRTRPRPPWSQSDPTAAFKECILRDLPAALLPTGDRQMLARLGDLAKESSDERRQDMERLLDRLGNLLQTTPGAPVDLAPAWLEAASDQRLTDFLGSVADLVGRDRRLLLICDQFEELFVHYGNSPAMDRFIKELGEVWANGSLALHLLFSMREDWVGSMIAFRQSIPEIFKNYFRLLPITCDRAEAVLAFPFRESGGFPPEVRGRILDDLAACYGGNERQSGSRDGGKPLMKFVELPALQVIAERLWETREEQEVAFSEGHYESLLPVAAKAAGESGSGELPAITPTQFVLEHYLMDSVDAVSKGEEKAAAELRLDGLYLLTDGERHRRASTVQRLKRGLRAIRPSELELPTADEAAIRRALEPLVSRGLVRRFSAEEHGDEYELAHDFAVRAVVKAWRELDRRRTRELGRLVRERRKKDTRLGELEGGRRTLLRLLQGLPVVGLASFIWAGFFLALGHTGWLVVADYLPGPMTVAAMVFFAVAMLALIAKSRASLFMGILGLAIAGGMSLMTYLYQASLGSNTMLFVRETTQNLESAAFAMEHYDSSVASEMKSVMAVITESPVATWPSKLDPSRLESLEARIRKVAGTTRDSRLLSGLNALEGINRLMRSIGRPPIVLLLLLLGLTLAQILAYLWVLATLAVETGGARLEAIALGMYSELVDILLHLVLVVPGGLALFNKIAGWPELLAANAVLVIGVSIIGVTRFGTTPGLALTGRVLASSRRLRFPEIRVVIRQTLFFAWAALNVCALLGWLLVSPWLFVFDRKRRGFYDLAARTFPVLREEFQTAGDRSSTTSQMPSEDVSYPIAA
ncbi:MAG TPA: hypothetical protein VGG20_09685 [Thermoanaerobaculia bacterium]